MWELGTQTVPLLIRSLTVPRLFIQTVEFIVNTCYSLRSLEFGYSKAEAAYVDHTLIKTLGTVVDQIVPSPNSCLSPKAQNL